MKVELAQQIIDGVIKLGMLAISAFAFVSAVQSFFKERSIGKTALHKVKEEHEAIKREVEQLKKDNVEKAEDIAHIESKYEKLIASILNNFPFKQ